MKPRLRVACLALAAASCRNPNPYFDEPPLATTTSATGTSTSPSTTSTAPLTGDETAGSTTTVTGGSISNSATDTGASTSTTDPIVTTDTTDPIATTGTTDASDTSDSSGSSTGGPLCGNGLVEPGEACDDGPANSEVAACTDACAVATCGDGLVHLGAEQCDDANLVANDGCSSCVPDLKMAMNYKSTCALTPGGALRCWGDNNTGQLGQGDTIPLGDNPGELPTPPVQLGGIAIDVAFADLSGCAVMLGGAVRCWGANQYGQLGINSTEIVGEAPGDMPPSDAMVGAPVVALAHDGEHTVCAITDVGALRCWGRNDAGQLGQGSQHAAFGDQPGELPLPDIPVGFAVVEVALGTYHVCARSAAGQVRCWGSNQFGQLGFVVAENVGDEEGELPVADVDLGGIAVQISAGGNFNCALMQGGAVRCWGLGENAQLGLGNTDTIGDGPGEMPPPPVDLGGPAIQVVAAESHACALMSGGAIRCWGNGQFGVLGTGVADFVGDVPGDLPPDAAIVGGPALAVWSEWGHACALLPGPALRCWGSNMFGELGLGHTDDIGDDELPTSEPLVPYQ